MQNTPSSASVRSAMRTCRSALVGIFLVSSVLNILMLTGPIFMLQVYDRVLASNSVPTLLVLAGIALTLYLFSGLLDILRSQALSLISLRVYSKLSLPAFFAGVQLPLLLGRKAGTMEPMRDLDHVKRFLGSSGPAAIFDLPFMPFYFALLFFFHPWLGVLALAGGLVIFVLVVANEFSAREPSRHLVSATSAQHAVVSSARRNAEVLRAMGMFDSFAQRFGNRMEDFYDAQRRVADRGAFFSSLTKMLRLVLQSAMLALGAYLAILQQISPGVMIASSIIMARALSPIEQAVGNWPTFVAARQAASRLKETLAKAPAAKGIKDMPLPTQALAVSQLATAAPGEVSPTLQGVTFSLEAGDGLGVIGPSGSGKTSFVRALVGIWPVLRGGSVRLDGATVEQWTQNERGRFIGYLPQDVELFEGTVAENIARFVPDPSIVEIIRAAKLAGVHRLITALPEGYNCMIGEAGARLSAGQRQRIGLARALFGRPFLIVLDEPNSNLDAEGERALAQAVLDVRQQGSIVIMVAHRTSALSAVNKMLVIRDGQQVDFGPRDAVLTKIAPALMEGNPRRVVHA